MSASLEYVFSLVKKIETELEAGKLSTLYHQNIIQMAIDIVCVVSKGRFWTSLRVLSVPLRNPHGPSRFSSCSCFCFCRRRCRRLLLLLFSLFVCCCQLLLLLLLLSSCVMEFYFIGGSFVLFSFFFLFVCLFVCLFFIFPPHDANLHFTPDHLRVS